MAFKKKEITIFAGSSSIGFGLAKRFIRICKVNLFFRSANKMKKIKSYFSKKNIENISFNLFQFNNENTIAKNIIKYKKILSNSDVIINPIGEQGEITNFFKINLKKFENTFKINFYYHLIFLKNLNKILKKKKNKLIILFSGGGSTSYRKNFVSYSISKTALVKLAEIFSYELNNKNRINILAPGIIKSRMTKKVLQKASKVDKNEILKLKKNIKNSEKNINSIFNTINFLQTTKGSKINGKFISSSWDAIDQLSNNQFRFLLRKDSFTLRRKDKIV